MAALFRLGFRSPRPVFRIDHRRWAGGLAVVAALTATTAAHAGGYDTPMLYSARHMGMGGAAVGYVRDPSALFHNPAGLGHVGTAAILGDFSLLLGHIQGSPANTSAGTSIESELTTAPFFLVGSAFRITDFLVGGLGLYPIASSGASYRYNDFEDRTELFFLEATPALAVNIDAANLRLGAGYRVTYVRLERFQGSTRPGVRPATDLKLAGHNFAGFRLGAQWTPLPMLELGLAYRHVTTTEVETEGGAAIGLAARDVSTKFKLPSKLVFGLRWTITDRAALASDVEYNFNSQNKAYPLSGTRADNGDALSVPNVFNWSNSATLRFGGEYKVVRTDSDQVALRAGYVFDSKTANRKYPTAFGTPPVATHVFTGGGGWKHEAFQVNLAYARRFGSTTITEADLEGAEPCRFCGYDGDYEIRLNGLYLDVSYEL